MTGPCPTWCLVDHGNQDACEGLTFETDAVSAPAGLIVGIREGEHGQAAVFVEEIGEKTGLYLPVLELTGEQIAMMRDAFMELSCHVGVCDCGGFEGCPSSPKYQPTI